MQLPAKAHYAALAMLALAMRHDDLQPVAIRTIAEEHDIPLPFLTQILQQLKSGGLVVSTRGASGGYRLHRDPARISLADIVSSVCAPSSKQAVTADSSFAHHVLQRTWDDLDTCLQDYLKHILLSDLVEQIQKVPERMFYI